MKALFQTAVLRSLTLTVTGCARSYGRVLLAGEEGSISVEVDRGPGLGCYESALPSTARSLVDSRLTRNPHIRLQRRQ